MLRGGICVILSMLLLGAWAGESNPADDDELLFVSTVEVEHPRISALHAQPCPAHYRDYCLNGGSCHYLHQTDKPHCRCSAEFAGHRCELFALERRKRSSSEGAAAAAAASLFLGGIALVVLFVAYHWCKRKRRIEAETREVFL
ncbi:pro-neuregulin-4, membrane-bound isoform isoform X1 [Lampetra planeri]